MSATSYIRSESERIREALQFIPPTDRDTWLRVGMAIKSELGNAGFGAWDTWSQQDEAHRPSDAREAWRSFKQSRGVTIASLFHMAKANGWRDGKYQKPTPAELAERQRQAAERTRKASARLDRQRAEAKRKALAIWNAGDFLNG